MPLTVCPQTHHTLFFNSTAPVAYMAQVKPQALPFCYRRGAGARNERFPCPRVLCCKFWSKAFKFRKV